MGSSQSSSAKVCVSAWRPAIRSREGSPTAHCSASARRGWAWRLARTPSATCFDVLFRPTPGCVHRQVCIVVTMARLPPCPVMRERGSPRRRRSRSIPAYPRLTEWTRPPAPAASPAACWRRPPPAGPSSVRRQAVQVLARLASGRRSAPSSSSKPCSMAISMSRLRSVWTRLSGPDAALAAAVARWARACCRRRSCRAGERRSPAAVGLLLSLSKGRRRSRSRTGGRSCGSARFIPSVTAALIAVSWPSRRCRRSPAWKPVSVRGRARRRR